MPGYRWDEAQLLEHEKQVLGFLDCDIAQMIGREAVRLADARAGAITVQVTRGAQVLFHLAMEGTSADQDDWLRRKINTVRRFGHSSQYMMQRLDQYADAYADFALERRDHVLAGGAVPIFVEGAGAVGAVAVAGLAGEDDHIIAVEALTAAVRRITASRHPGAAGGVPTVRSVDHVAYTVPDLAQAIDFFCTYLGGELVFEDGPFSGEYMRTKLNVHPDSRCRLAMVRMGTTLNLELFEYEAPERSMSFPRNSDVGGGHLALYVDDADAAWDYLMTVPGVVLQEGPNGVADTSPVRGQRWFYFLTPWGQQMEITSDGNGNNYAGLPAERLAMPAVWR